MKWQEIISDPVERQVFEALADAKFDFRTIEGISKATGLPQELVRSIIQKNDHLIRKSSLRDKKGRLLYSLKDRPESTSEKLSKFRTYFSKSMKTFEE